MTDEKTADITTIQRVSREMRMAQKVLTGDGPITGCVSAFAPFPVSPDILGSRLYTSYKTSVALRDAGAPQGDGSNHHWRVPGEFDVPPFTPWLGTYRSSTADVRAFRADEIIKVLEDRLDTIVRYREPEEYRVVLADELGSSLAYSLVEALAAAWLAVLKEVPRG